MNPDQMAPDEAILSVSSVFSKDNTYLGIVYIKTFIRKKFHYYYYYCKSILIFFSSKQNNVLDCSGLTLIQLRSFCTNNVVCY